MSDPKGDPKGKRMERRCEWVWNDPLMIEYHDNEWGVPLHNDKKLFEFLVLDAMQAGLNWLMVLKKRENFREASLLFLDCSKARRLLDWRPALSLEEGIEATVLWTKKLVGKDSMFELGMELVKDYTDKAKERGLSWARN